MSDPLDYYDVQAMIRDEVSAVRGEALQALNDTRRELRDELDGAVRELRRLIDSRTEHAV